LQSFISLQMRLEILRKLMERDFNAGMTDLTQLQALAQTQVRDLRTFLHSMRPVDVDGADLVATARRAAESFQKESGIPVTFLGTNSPVGLPAEMTQEVLQMVREALHNVQKHAGATRVAVAMEKTDRGLEISVDDNGHGFGFAGSYSLEELELLRLGPASLKRRARSLNADLLLESRPGSGSGIKFRIPLT
jgi:signal transduction histidine kinase